MNRIGASLQRKLGPLPVWAWALIAGGVLYVVRNRGAAASSGSGSADSGLQPLQPLAGGPGDGSGQGGGSGGGSGSGDDGGGPHPKPKKHKKKKRRRRHHKPPPHHGRNHPPHRPHPRPKRRVKGRKHPHRDRLGVSGGGGRHVLPLAFRRQRGASKGAGVPAFLSAGQTRHTGARAHTGGDRGHAELQRTSSPTATAPARRSRAMSSPGETVRGRYQAPTVGAPPPRQAKARPAQGAKTATVAQASGSGQPRGTRRSARIHHRRRRSS